MSTEAVQSYSMQYKCGPETVHIISVHKHYIAPVVTHPFGPDAVASTHRSDDRY